MLPMSSLQMKLSLDQGLQNVWNYLSDEYEGLDKASIVRLALTNLAKTTKRQNAQTSTAALDSLEYLKTTEKGMTEDEFFTWWSQNKSSLR